MVEIVYHYQFYQVRHMHSLCWCYPAAEMPISLIAVSIAMKAMPIIRSVKKSNIFIDSALRQSLAKDNMYCEFWLIFSLFLGN